MQIGLYFQFEMRITALCIWTQCNKTKNITTLSIYIFAMQIGVYFQIELRITAFCIWTNCKRNAQNTQLSTHIYIYCYFHISKSP